MMSHYSQTSEQTKLSTRFTSLNPNLASPHPAFLLTSISKLILLCLRPSPLLFLLPGCSSSAILPAPILLVFAFEFKGCSVLLTPGHGVTCSANTEHCSSWTLSKVIIVYTSVIMITQSPERIQVPRSQGCNCFAQSWITRSSTLFST